ncbi:MULTISPECIES: hypothetical protein [Kitasatospora]|uniref:Uncharacterized protein n=1 Tax=Kitasatospora cathayae TaxID=3004092 RepID=A0ABY7PVG1_9ACTN|nr:hypothetical protein [Kitasatospora sp. HUAS 3-15]WBP84417.1 hypothetical protein O1G21_00150 [Kitasatospora sp. HUAS 3-15]
MPRPFLVRGRAVPLARYLAEEQIEGLVACSCIGNEVTIDLGDTRILVTLADVGGVVGLTFHMVQDGPAKARTWTRRLSSDTAPRELAASIARDVRTLERELAPLRRRPPEGTARRPAP